MCPWCLPGGVGGLGLLVAGILLYNALGGRTHPWGTLRPVKTPPGHSLSDPLPITSGLLRTGRAVIGSSRRADIRLDGGDVRGRHAAIKAVRRTVTERVGRPPSPVQVETVVNVVENLGEGTVAVDRTPVPRGRQSAPLQDGTRVTIGEYEFVYEE